MILQRLRHETRPQHEALEQLLPLGRPHLPLAVYKQVLLRFHGFYRTWEAEAQAHAGSSLAPVLAARRKLPLLQSDLQALGLDPASQPPLDPARLPRFAGSPATLLGSMYVVEGSTLGGQLIARELERSSGFRDGLGYLFFRSYGITVGQQWKAFTALLQSAPPDQADAIVAGARDTFTAFADWFAPDASNAIKSR